MATPLDIKGCRFGKLTVISLIPEDERRNKYNRREWLCKCDCGNSIIVEQRHLIRIISVKGGRIYVF